MFVNTEAGTVTVYRDNVAAFLESAEFVIEPELAEPVSGTFTMKDLDFVARIHPAAVSFEGAIVIDPEEGFVIELNRALQKAAGWLRYANDGTPVDTSGIKRVEIDAKDMKNIKVKFISDPA